MLASNNLSDLANAATARTNLGVAIGTNVQAYAAVLANTTASFLTADKTKLAGIEALADVTDTANVTAAGALMDSEVDADIKTLVLPTLLSQHLAAPWLMTRQQQTRAQRSALVQQTVRSSPA